jgi:hypothetical protein
MSSEADRSAPRSGEKRERIFSDQDRSRCNTAGPYFRTWISNKTSNSLFPSMITHFSFNASLNHVDAHGSGFGPTLPFLAIIAGIYLVTVILVWSAREWSTQKIQEYHTSTI